MSLMDVGRHEADRVTVVDAEVSLQQGECVLACSVASVVNVCVFDRVLVFVCLCVDHVICGRRTLRWHKVLELVQVPVSSG